MVRCRMIKDFIELKSTDTVGKARQELAANPGYVLAIFDDNGKNWHILTGDYMNIISSDQLSLARLLRSNSSVMVTFPEVKLRNLVKSPQFINHKPAIVLEQGKVVGILTAETIEHYENKQRGPTKGGGGSSSLLSDTMLAGATKTPRLQTTVADEPLYYYHRHQK